MSNVKVDIIFPVFNHLVLVKELIKKLQAFADFFYLKLILINDVSHEKELLEYCLELKVGIIAK